MGGHCWLYDYLDSSLQTFRPERSLSGIDCQWAAGHRRVQKLKQQHALSALSSERRELQDSFVRSWTCCVSACSSPISSSAYQSHSCSLGCCYHRRLSTLNWASLRRSEMTSPRRHLHRCLLISGLRETEARMSPGAIAEASCPEYPSIVPDLAQTAAKKTDSDLGTLVRVVSFPIWDRSEGRHLSFWSGSDSLNHFRFAVWTTETT